MDGFLQDFLQPSIQLMSYVHYHVQGPANAALNVPSRAYRVFLMHIGTDLWSLGILPGAESRGTLNTRATLKDELLEIPSLRISIYFLVGRGKNNSYVCIFKNRFRLSYPMK